MSNYIPPPSGGLNPSADHQAPQPYPAAPSAVGQPNTPHPAGRHGPGTPPPAYGSGYSSGAANKPRKSRTVLVATITGIVALTVGIALGSLSGDGEPVGAANPSPMQPEEPVEVPGAGEGDADVEPAGGAVEDSEDSESESAETVEPEEEPTAEEGTRSNPYPIGTEVGNEEWTIVLGDPRESGDEIQAENRYNDPADDGFEYYIVPMTATYTGDETGQAAWDLTVRFVGSDGVTYDDRCGTIPDPIRDVGELYEGGVAEGNVCLTVPAGAGGLWTVTAGWVGEPVFFVAED